MMNKSKLHRIFKKALVEEILKHQDYNFYQEEELYNKSRKVLEVIILTYQADISISDFSRRPGIFIHFKKDILCSFKE